MKTKKIGRKNLGLLVTGYVAVGLFLLWVGGLTYAYAQGASKDFLWLAGTLSAIGAILFVLYTLIITDRMTKTVAANSALVQDGKIIEVFPEKLEFWKWQFRKLAGGAELITAVPHYLNVGMQLQPITQNPKVRKLSYNINIRVHETPDDVLQLRSLLAPWKSRGIKDVTSLLEFICYEFNERASQELAKFYNPRDLEQQKSFAEAVVSFVKKQLGEKLPFKVQRVSFSLGDPV